MYPSVTQKHGAGCAVACVAWVLSVSYDVALKIFSRPKQAVDRGFLCREIVSALTKDGRNYTYCKAIDANKKFVRVPGSIVFIARSKKYPIGHFLTRTVEDSWINFPCIASAESGFQKRLPGKAQWIIYPIQ